MTSRKKRTPKKLLAAAVVAAASAVLLFVFAGPTKAALERVPLDRVCMVNDKVFPTPQIPVQVGSKTYFGCCEMCKSRLANDEAVRMARDPVSLKPVDKAQAVVAARRDGRVVYFESEETLAAYQKGPAS